MKNCIIQLDKELKVLRVFHGSVESADAIMKGWEISYNFILKHQSLKRCPYKLATDLELKEKINGWS